MRRPPERLSGEQVIAAAQRLVPTLRERADQSDQARRVPDESFSEMQREGLFHTLKPSKYGGFELGVYEYATVSMELARGCGSSGWIYSLLSEHCWFLSMFPAAAQDDLWGEDSYQLSAASISADPSRTRAERVAGGYRVSGRFPFASGSDHAGWMLLAAPVASADPTQQPETYFFLVPKHALTPIDDWFVLGMRGTGSRSFQADDLFVPAHRAARRDDVFGARTEGPLLHPTFALLKAPRAGITPFVASAPAVGVAIGAVETFSDLARGLRRRGGSLRESDVVKLKLSESAAETHAARLIVEHDTKETMAHVRAGEPIPAELRARLLRDSAFVGLLSQRAVDRLHMALGSSAIFDGHPLQRAFRDVHTCLAQAAMHWEVRGLEYAEFAMSAPAGDGYETR
jgi:3-hydroxy-9,10-secoandrosta-1,3,5(10)-triene-9,17-dione monooxygenase